MKYPCKNPFKLREASSAELVAYIEVAIRVSWKLPKKYMQSFSTKAELPKKKGWIFVIFYFERKPVASFL